MTNWVIPPLTDWLNVLICALKYMQCGIYPSRGAACRWACLEDLRRLISNLWICHDWWGAEWVGVWIRGHVLLRHTNTRLSSNLCLRTQTKKGNKTYNHWMSKLTEFLCISPILFLMLAIMLSNMPKGFLIMSCTNTRAKEQPKVRGVEYQGSYATRHSVLSAHKQLHHV